MSLKKRPLSLAASLTALLLCSATPSRAQDGNVRLYAGYSFFHSDDGSLHGVRLSPEYRLKGFLSLTGDFSGEFGTLADTDTTLTTFLGGLRARQGLGGAAVFIHALAGGARVSSSIAPFQGVKISVSDTGLALDAGGGLEFKAGRLRMRAGADYLQRRVDVGGGKTANEHDVRATVGFVF
jgi:hypothetical protein